MAHPSAGRRSSIGALVAVGAMVLAGCSPGEDGTRGLPDTSTTTAARPPTTSTTTTTTTSTVASTTTTTLLPKFALSGSVVDVDGVPVSGANVSVDGVLVVTDGAGKFAFDAIPVGPIDVSRPAWLSTTYLWAGSVSVEIELQPRVVRALRASKYVAADDQKFAALLELTRLTSVNALVFDTKDESGFVLYETNVEKALEIDSVRPMYDATRRLEQTRDAGLYAITRIVSFEDAVWVAGDPDVKLAGRWIDPRQPDHWEYPLALAVEACELGFDEIQFDYVRFPAGRSAVIAQASTPTTPEERVATIEAFLAEATGRLHPLGCAVSATVFAIVFSAPNEQGIGQRPEELSQRIDAISPMIYPSHYSSGWLGFDDPNDHPGAVTARALDDGGPRVSHPALIRPWLQAFSYNAGQVMAGIAEAEVRGHGWMLWNPGGDYALSWLPPAIIDER